MSVQKRWLAAALVGATALAGPVFAQTAAPAIKREIAVRVAPVNLVPDAGETDGSGIGPEARDAVSVGPASAETARIMATSLNAQLTSLQGPAAAPPPRVIEVSPVAETVSEPQLLPAVATTSSVGMVASLDAAPEVATSQPSGPSVALARRVVESAEAFADYMQRASGVRPDYADAAGVERAVRSAGIYEPVQLQEGAIAYVALAALQDPEFVRSVDALGHSGEAGRLAQQLVANPRLIMQLPNSAAAAARAAKALGRMGSSLSASGAAVKQSAYDIQHSAWSKGSVTGPAAMLADVKARSGLREALASDGGQAMLASLTQLRSDDREGGSGRLTPVVAQGLTLAALAVLGEAGEEHTDRVSALLSDANSAQCLKMARLNLYQCLSVAGPNYEDVFCLGQHGMLETARCVADASGWMAPARGVAVPIARSSSILVPVALAAREPMPAAQPVEAVSEEIAEPGDPADATPIGSPPPIGRANAYPVGLQFGGGAR